MEDSAAAEDAGEERDAGEEGELPPEERFRHDPFTFRIFSIVAERQSRNGLRHGDHLRYRQYCARRGRRLNVALRFKHGRGRYKQNPLPQYFDDMRYLEIPLVNAERAWGYGTQLKSDNATASAFNARWRGHSIRRFAKAAHWADVLERISKEHCDPRTQLEAEAYTSWMRGILLLEKEQYAEALPHLQRCRKHCGHLGLASSQEEGGIFKARSSELAPMIRECKYRLGRGYDDEDDDDDGAPSSDQRAQDLSELSYRGEGLAVPSESIKARLMKCLQLVSEVKTSSEDESAVVIERYGELSAEFGDALQDIHGDMIAAGAAGQTREWRMLEAFARELSVCMNIERNLVLLGNHLLKLDKVLDPASSEARRNCRPEEGMRFCDLLKEDLGSLQELPETTSEISEVLSAYLSVAQNGRCLFLALCHSSVGKGLEAAALLDLLHARVDDVVLGDALLEPLARLHPLFSQVQEKMPARVARWRCRNLALLAAQEAKAKEPGPRADAADAQAPGALPPSALGELCDLEPFPPRVRNVPCKPLLFDLAFPAIQAPDLESLMPKRADDGKKKGLLSRAATGLGSRIGGLWGRK